MIKKLIVSVVLVAAVATAQANPKTHATAYALSGIGTGVSVALMTSAFFLTTDTGELNYPLLAVGFGTSLVTPSLGNFYAEHWLNIGMGVRLAAGGVAAYVAATMRQDHRCPLTTETTCTELTDNGMIALGIIGIVYIGGAAYDFKALGLQVDEYNAKHPFQWAPVIMPSPSGPGAVLGIGGTF